MNTTRAMLVIGVLMLVLAVIVAQGLRPEEATTVSGPVFSGTVSRSLEQPPVTVVDEHDRFSESTVAPSPVQPLALGENAVPQTDNPNPMPLKTVDASTSSPKRVTEEQKTEVRENPVKAVQSQEQTRPVVPNQPPRVVTTNGPKNLAPGQKAISRTRLEIGTGSVTFRMTGEARLEGKAFTLKEPDRVVVDLNGAWGINLGRTPENRILKSVRSGNQQANTRLVFDMHRAPRSFKLVQVAPRTLELQIR